MKKENARRNFITSSIKAGVAVGLASTMPASGFARETEIQTGFSQTPLPYAFNALEPYIDALTMEIHYTKHAAAYVKGLNEAATLEFKGANISLQEAFGKISSYSAKLRNNGGGHFNHEMFWQSMQPSGGKLPEGELKTAISAAFGSADNFKTKLSEAAMTRFGSGWAWLYLDEKKSLQIGSTPNQDNPLMDVSPIKGTPLLGLDVWEHAYYLKYQNKRAEYVSNWFNLINWEVVENRWRASR